MDNIELHPSALEILMPATENKVVETDMCAVVFPDTSAMECYEIIAQLIRRNHVLVQLTIDGPRGFRNLHPRGVISSYFVIVY